MAASFIKFSILRILRGRLYGNLQLGLKFQLAEISSRLSSKLFEMTLQITCKNFNSLFRFSQPEMKFQPGMKIRNFLYYQHFSNRGENLILCKREFLVYF